MMNFRHKKTAVKRFSYHKRLSLEDIVNLAHKAKYQGILVGQKR